jgi:hypothetical protein
MAKQSKRTATQANESAQDNTNVQEETQETICSNENIPLVNATQQEPADSQDIVVSIDGNNTANGQEPPLNQEIRLAEAQPGDIEALEETIDQLEERSSGQNTYILHQDAIIEELECALISLEPTLTLVNAQASLITALVEQLNVQKTALEQSTAVNMQPTVTRSTDRKSEALALLNPNNESVWPGPPVSITQLANAMGTNNKNVSSVLSALRDQGYQIATDELGRKFIKNHTPGQSAKTPKYTQYEAATTNSQPTITSIELTNLISQAQGTIVKRTVDGIVRVN